MFVCQYSRLLACCLLRRSNVVGNSFTVLDAGHSVKARNRPPDVVSSQCELASIHYVRVSLVLLIFLTEQLCKNTVYIRWQWRHSTASVADAML